MHTPEEAGAQVRAILTNHAPELMYWDHARGWRVRCYAGDWTGAPAGYAAFQAAADAHTGHVLEVARQAREIATRAHA